jgi:DNA-binding MarR family transcriptional regulator
MLKNTNSLEDNLIKSFYNIFNLIELILRVKTESTLSLRESFLLFVVEKLSQNGENTVSNVANELKLSTSGASQAISTLEKKSFLSRQHDQNDRRIYYINLTEKSKKVLQAQAGFRQRVLTEMTDELSLFEKKLLIDVINKLNNFVLKDFERMKVDLVPIITKDPK